jgi:hypothetical protein
MSERLGLKLTRAAVPPPVAPANKPKPGQSLPDDLNNEDGPVIDSVLTNRASSEFVSAVADDLQLLRDRVAAIESISDPDLRARKRQALLDEWDQLTKDILADPGSARVLAGLKKSTTTKS